MPQRKGIYAAAIGFAASAALTTIYQPTAAAHASKRAEADKGSTALHISHLDSSAPRISIRLPKSSSTKQFSGTIFFNNDTDYKVTLRLKRSIRISNSNVPRTLTLEKGASRKIPFTGSISAGNGYTSAGLVYGSSMGGLSTALVNIEVKNGKFRPVKTGDFGIGDPGSASTAVPRNARIQPGIKGYKQFLKGGITFGKPSKKMKGKSKKSASLEIESGSSTAMIGQSWTTSFTNNLSHPYIINWLSTNWKPYTFISQALNNISSIFVPQAAAANGVYKGRFVFQTQDASGMYFPAAGIGVKAVKANDSCTHNPPLARTIADGNGNFQFNINTSGSYKICYFTKNSFTKIGRQVNSDLYIWADPARNTIPNAREVRQPVRHDGVFDIWFEAMAFQTSMTNAGIDPARTGSNKIRIKFPSEAGDCRPSSPWSCAFGNGELYVAPEHAVRHGTMSHELAHQVDNKYTLDQGIDRPAGLGGPHSFYGCYPPNLTTPGWAQGQGMIIREGWANYEMARALGTRGSSKYRNSFRSDIGGSLIDGINFDANGRDCTGVSNIHTGRWADDLGLTPAQRNFDSGLNGSESTVSTILWDFYDTRNDNNDNLHYVSPYRITNMYLQGHPTNSAEILNERIMRDCRADINKAVTNDGQVCDDIFAQNGGED